MISRPTDQKKGKKVDGKLGKEKKAAAAATNGGCCCYVCTSDVGCYKARAAAQQA